MPFDHSEKPKKVYGGRAMLNLPGHHSTASIVAEIDDTKDWKPDKDDQTYMEAPWPTVRISDCDRSVSLEMNFESRADFANNIHKIDTIVAVLKDFKKGLLVEQERYVKRKMVIEDNKAKKKAEEKS